MVAKRSNDLGPTGQRLARNVKARRETLGLTLADVANRLATEGRPIGPLALRRIELADDEDSTDDRKPRRVDADDLVALAWALETTPNALLVGPQDGDSVDLTPARSMSAREAWAWASRVEDVPEATAREVLPHLGQLTVIARAIAEFEAASGLDLQQVQPTLAMLTRQYAAGIAEGMDLDDKEPEDDGQPKGEPKGGYRKVTRTSRKKG